MKIKQLGILLALTLLSNLALADYTWTLVDNRTIKVIESGSENTSFEARTFTEGIEQTEIAKVPYIAIHDESRALKVTFMLLNQDGSLSKYPSPEAKVWLQVLINQGYLKTIRFLGDDGNFTSLCLQIVGKSEGAQPRNILGKRLASAESAAALAIGANECEINQ